MSPTKEAQHQQRVFRSSTADVKILQAAIVYGANASGKSNLCKALAFLRSFLVGGPKPKESINRSPFKLRSSTLNEPTEFEIEVMVTDGDEDHIYRYHLSLNSREVLFESLVEIRSASEKPIFTRRAGTVEHKFDLFWTERKAISDEDRQFARFVARGTGKNQPFLSEAAYRNIRFLKPILAWFRDQLVIVEPHAEYLSLETLAENRQELRDFAAEFLGDANTGIVAIDSQDVPLEAIGFPPTSREQIASQLTDGGPGMLVRTSHGERFSIFLQHGELKAAKVRTFRKAADSDIRVSFEVSEESDGTMRLFDLAPLFHDLIIKGSRKTYVIDELDRSLHTALTRQLCVYFLSSCSEHSRSQLIATVHDTQLLDQDLFRRDEIWFAIKTKGGASTLARLCDSKSLRHDKDLRRGYLQGLFGEFPNIEFKIEPTQQELF